MPDQDEIEKVPQEDLHNHYEGITFNCVECGDGTVFIRPDDAECYVCGQMYDVEIDVTVGEKKEQGWPPDE